MADLPPELLGTDVGRLLCDLSQVEGIGVDIEDVGRFAGSIPRVFTAAEVEYCEAQTVPAISYAGRWCAKEAIVKASLPNRRLGLREVEIRQGSRGEPEVWLARRMSGIIRRQAPFDTQSAFLQAEYVAVTIAHTRDLAVAVAVVRR